MSEKYILIKPADNCGMCGYIWQTIRVMFHNPDKKYYIDFENSIYKASDDNVWDLFFEQPHIDKKPSEDQIEEEIGMVFDVETQSAPKESEFVWSETQPNTPDEIQRRRDKFCSLIEKNIKLKPHVQKKVDNFVEQNFKGKKVLGVHLRGTDHPEKKHMDVYLQAIKEKIKDYDVLFICSDDHDRFRLATVAFKNKAVSYNSIRSRKDGFPLHEHPHLTSYGIDRSFEYQYKIAEDVIIEAYLMSKVDFLLCCPASNVNYFSRSINPKLQCEEL